MEFESSEEAWKFWKFYGEEIGFGVTRSYTNKSKKDGSITTCRFVCCKQGVRGKDKRDYQLVKHRPKMKTNCNLRIELKHMNDKVTV